MISKVKCITSLWVIEKCVDLLIFPPYSVSVKNATPRNSRPQGSITCVLVTSRVTQSIFFSTYNFFSHFFSLQRRSFNAPFSSGQFWVDIERERVVMKVYVTGAAGLGPSRVVALIIPWPTWKQYIFSRFKEKRREKNSQVRDND